MNLDSFPLSSNYDMEWITAESYGANPIWLAEWLCSDLELHSGMHVLDLGCGTAKSSVFLAREFGVRVTAVDLWNSPTENHRRICDMGMQASVTSVRADARDLPFAHESFDAIVAVDSFQYFGTDMLYLPYITQFLKAEGSIAFASAGLMRNIGPDIPQHLTQFWQSDAWCLQTSEWWREHWTRTDLVRIAKSETMPDGWQHWLRWAEINEASDWYLETLRKDAGRFLGYIKTVAVRCRDSPRLPYDLRTGK